MKTINNLKHFTTAVVLMLAIANISYSQQKEIKHEKVSPSKTGTANFKDLEQKAKQHPPDTSKVMKSGPEEDTKPPKEEPLPKGAKRMIFKERPTEKNDSINQPRKNIPQGKEKGFPAFIDNSSLVPPDLGGAVGPNYVMTALNTQVIIHDKSGVAVSMPMSLSDFFDDLSSGFSFFPFDPRVIYDPYAQRWIVTAFSDPGSATAAVLIAVSNTDDPNGSWTFSSYDVDVTDANWLDFPCIGFNKNWVVITGFMYPNNNNDPLIGGKIYMFDKNALYAGPTSPTVATYASGYRIVPPITYDNTTNDMTLVKDYNGMAPGGGSLRLFTITGTSASPVFSATMLFPTALVNWKQSAPTDANGFPLDFAPQQGSAQKIQTNSSHIQNAVMRNGSLWCTQTVFLPSSGTVTRSSIQWWQINPITGNPIQFGRIDDVSGVNFYAFPSIAVNAYDDVLIGYTRFSASQFASANYSFRLHTDALNTLNSEVTFKNGLASYYKPANGQNRWGDYSATAVDPDEFSLWTLQEYAELPSGGSDRWGTEWNQFTIPVPELYVKDRSDDNGAEPNPTTLPMWQSEDIWVRNDQDAIHAFAHMHQNAEYRIGIANPNYVYVEVHNRGGASSDGTEQLHLYWAKASSGLSWTDPWNGGVYFDPPTNTMLMGSQIGTVTIPVTAPGASNILEFAWNPADPAIYEPLFGADKKHFCLLARVTTSAASPYGMTFTETDELYSNVQNNNNIAWKNIKVFDDIVGNAPAYAVAVNLTDKAIKTKFRFNILDGDGVVGLLNKGTLKVTAGGKLKDILKQNHVTGDGIKDVGDGTFEIYKDGAIIENVILQPKDFGILTMQFKPNDSKDLKGGFALILTQIDQSNGTDKIIGGETAVFGKVRGFGTEASIISSSGWRWWHWALIGLILTLFLFWRVKK